MLTRRAVPRLLAVLPHPLQLLVPPVPRQPDAAFAIPVDSARRETSASIRPGQLAQTSPIDNHGGAAERVNLGVGRPLTAA